MGTDVITSGLGLTPQGTGNNTESNSHTHAYSGSTGGRSVAHTHSFSGTTGAIPQAGGTEGRPESLAVYIGILYRDASRARHTSRTEIIRDLADDR